MTADSGEPFSAIVISDETARRSAAISTASLKLRPLEGDAFSCYDEWRVLMWLPGRIARFQPDTKEG